MAITGEDVKKAMIESEFEEAIDETCAECGYVKKYIRRGEVLHFDSGCDCSGGPTITERPWDEVAEAIEAEEHPALKKQLAARFGIEV